MAAATFLAILLPGEVLPKTAAFLAPLRVAPLVAPMMATLVRLASPVHRLLGAVFVEPLTRLLSPARPTGPFQAEEVAGLLALSQKRGLIAPDQTELLREVLELTGLQAGDVMVPRVDMVAYPADGDRKGLLELIRQRRLTKIPLYESDLDHIVGIVHVKRLLLEEEASPRQLAGPVQFMPRTALLERVLLQFRATGGTLAIVVDEYGGTAGLLTLETVVEEIVGDIADAREAHGPSPVTQVAPGEWLVEGDLPVHEWAEAFLAQLPGLRFSTVGGLVVSLLGHIPSVGETAQYRNLQLTIEAMRRRRVTLVRVRLVEKT
jgi:CBS domain containing-hemolysin-like protein